MMNVFWVAEINVETQIHIPTKKSGVPDLVPTIGFGSLRIRLHNTGNFILTRARFVNLVVFQDGFRIYNVDPIREKAHYREQQVDLT
jgi:hypothetical protein